MDTGFAVFWATMLGALAYVAVLTVQQARGEAQDAPEPPTPESAPSDAAAFLADVDRLGRDPGGPLAGAAGRLPPTG